MSNQTTAQDRCQMRDEYMKCLRLWHQNATAYFNYNAMLYQQQCISKLSNPQQMATTLTIGDGTAASAAPAAPSAQQAEQQSMPNLLRMCMRSYRRYYPSRAQQMRYIRANGGYDILLPPYWKRILAEFIDMLLMLLLRVVMLEFVRNHITSRQQDYDYKFFQIFDFFFFGTRKSVYIELLFKLIIIQLEARFLVSYGATPGKIIMRLSVEQVTAIIDQNGRGFMRLEAFYEPRRAIISHFRKPDIRRAYIRAVLKNCLFAMYFPVMILTFTDMMLFSPNRPIYDSILKTIVIEKRALPRFARPL